MGGSQAGLPTTHLFTLMVCIYMLAQIFGRFIPMISNGYAISKG
jgi:hypothetical protein